MSLKKRLKNKIVIGLIFGLVLAFGLAMPLDGETQKIVVQASNNMNMSVTDFAPTSETENETETMQAQGSMNMSVTNSVQQSNTSMFTFVRLNATEVDVRLADRTVTEAIIPETAIVNGVEHTVTAIAPNSFINAPNLERVRLPRTIRTIGVAAFSNSSKLTSVTLPEGVLSIGANAFMNTALDHLIIPNTTTTIGATILRGTNGGNGTKVYARAASASAGWNATWNNNNPQAAVAFSSRFQPDIEYVLAPSGGYAVRSFQPFVSASDEDIYIPAYREDGTPVTYINDSAFDYTDARSITVGYHATPVQIHDMAFAWLFNVETITINRDVEFISEAGGFHFAGSTMTTVLLPNTITEIPDYAFSFGFPGNSNLTDIHFFTPRPFLAEDEEQDLVNEFTSTGTVILPNTVTSIGYGAFDHADLIENLHIRSTVQNVEAGAFSGWTDEQTLWIDYPGFVGSWDIGWYDNSEAVIEYVTRYTVTYAPNQPAFASSTVVGDTPESHPIIGQPTQLSENGFSLTGWHMTGWNTMANGTGTQYSLNSTINVPSATTSTVVVLHAQWAQNNYTVIYAPNIPSGAGPLQGSMTISHLLYDAPMRLTENAFELAGYNFLGWSLDSAFVGGPIPFVDGHLTPNITSENGATVTLYAIWEVVIIEIRTAAEFNEIRNNPTGHYRLMANINLSGSSWVPIPNFTGILEGNNRAIQSMNISYSIPTGGLNTDVNLGLFAIFNGTVSNLIFMNATIETTNEVQTGTGWLRAGLFAGTIGEDAFVSNVNFRGTFATVAVNRNFSEVGVFAGQITGGTVSNIWNHSAMVYRVEGQGYLGGIVGVMRGGSLMFSNTAGMVINYTRNTDNRAVGLLIGKIVNADRIIGNSIRGRINLQNASGGTLIGMLAGIGNADSANDWGPYDPIGQSFGSNFFGLFMNTVRLSNGTIITVYAPDNIFGVTFP